MNVSITDAKAQLPELVRRAEKGETIVLTRHGRPAVKMIPAEGRVRRPLDRKAIDAITARALAEIKPEDATSNHDFLYDENGLPK
jgi:prevent-host-death family protein